VGYAARRSLSESFIAEELAIRRGAKTADAATTLLITDAHDSGA
jgi:hypothetical protein